MKSNYAPGVVENITAYNGGRDPQRLALKYRALAVDPFAFLRGTCHLFYDALPAHPVLDEAPAAWLCGDLHAENFGTYKADDRQIYFDINDFDEAVLAPCSWDVVRLLTSLLVAAGTLSIAREEAIALSRNCLDTYGKTLAQGKAHWIDRDAAQGLIHALFQRLAERKRKNYIESRTVMQGKRRVIRIDHGKALAATDAEQQRIHAWLERYAANQENPHFFRPLDIARRVAGTGSLGLARFVILVEGKGGAAGHYLLDLKACLPSCLSEKSPFAQPEWPSEAVRVVSVGVQVQAVAPAFLEALEIEGKPYVLKGLQPSQDRIDLRQAAAHPKRLDRVGRAFAALAAWGQLRAAGRTGSAPADALIAFGQDRTQWMPLLDIAAHMAQQVERDWHAFAQHAADIDALVALSR